MVKRIKLIILLLFLAGINLYFSNCTHLYYAPNSHNVPMFKEKNDLQIGANIFTGLESTGYNFQGAYALNNHWAVNLNSLYAQGNYENEYGYGFFIEAGGGYFKPITEHFIAEIYADMGFGNVKNYYGSGNSDLSFTKHSIQPSIGFASKYFDMALSVRFSSLYYYRIGVSRNINSFDLDNVNYIINHPFFTLFEPAFTVRGGYGPVKLQVQYVLSYNNNPYFLQEVFACNLGLIINLGSLVRKNLRKN